MNKIKKLLTSFAIIGSFINVHAFDIEIDGVYYNITSAIDLTVAVAKNSESKYSGDIILPSFIEYSGKQFEVNSIEENAFSNCDNLNSISIPSSIRWIGEDAFLGTNLQYVEISSIEFWLSIGLKASSYTYGTPVGSNPFRSGAKIKIDGNIIDNLIIPEGIRQLNWNFAGSGIKSITLPTTFEYFDSNCLCRCRELTEIHLASEDVGIYDYSFYECVSLEDLSFLTKCSLLGSNSFGRCSGLTEVIIPNSITYLRGDPFPNCVNVRSCSIGTGLSGLHMDYGATNSNKKGTQFLSGCTSLNSLEFVRSENNINIYSWYSPGGEKGTFVDFDLKKLIVNRPIVYTSKEYPFNNSLIKYIEVYDWDCLNALTLNNCDSLEEIELSDHFEFIKSNPFVNCDNLKRLVSKNLVPPEWENFSATNSAIMNLCIYVPQEALETYKQSEGWKNFWNIYSIDEMPIKAKEITLNYNSVELNIKEKVQLEATVLPEDATEPTVIWSSSDEEIAIVSGDGLVTAISRGETIITATCGEVEDTCLITVFEQIKLNLESAELNVGESVQLEATINTEDSNDKSLIWESSDETVASVNQEGLVKGLSEGRAIITATYNDISASCQITVFGDKVYLVGSPVDWDVYGSNLYLSKINSDENIYSGTLELKKSADFRFYRLLGNWDEYYIGSMIEDMPLEIDFKTGEYIGDCVKGKGRWELDNWSGGKVTITLNLDKMDIQFIVKNEEETDQPDDTGVESLLANPESKISIYTTDGILIKKDCKVEYLKTLNKGIYIIISGKEHYKISI